MDSTEFNKIAGGLIGAFLLFLLLNFASGMIYGTRAGTYENEPLAFALAVEENAGQGGGASKAEATDYGALVAKADVANGEKVFRKCKSCHALEEGKNGVGPSLWGVVGRKIASLSGFTYSSALAGLEADWDLTHLGEFLKDPKGYAAGTKMAFPGLKDAQDRVDLIAYLNQADGTPIELAAAAPATGAGGGGDAKPADGAKPAGETKPEDKKPEDTKAADTKPDETKPEDTKAADTKPEDTKAADTNAADTKPEDTKPAAGTAGAGEGDKTEVAAADPNKDGAAAAGGETAAAFAGGDAAAGEKVFRKCKACHKLEEGKNGVGPSLWGVVNRDIASVDGYNYSQALKDLPGKWTATELSKYLAAPKDYARGTKMAFGGLKDQKDIVDLLTYINEADGTPDPLQ